MFKITFKFQNSTDRAGVWCENRNELCTMINILENNARVDQFVVETAGHRVKSLYNELGIGTVSKFVTEFQYKDTEL